MRREPNRLLIFFIVLISGFLIISKPALTKVLISKIQIAGVSSTDEFVELYNFSSSSISLENWSLKKLTSTGTTSTLVSAFPSTALMNPFGYFLIAHRDYLPTRLPAPDLFYTNSSYSLASNNSLLLSNNDGVEDRVDWALTSTNKEIVRLPNDDTGNFQDTDDSAVDFIELGSLPFNSTSPSRPFTSTTGSSIVDSSSSSTFSSTSSSIDTSTLWKYLKINEFLPDPATGTEWVELFNTNTDTIDLEGGTLCDNRSENCTIGNLAGAILPQSWFTYFLSSSKLNNDGDSVILKNPEGDVVDRVDYGNGKFLPGKGQSLARIEDGVDSDADANWAVTLNVTPNGQNIIELPPAPVQTAGASGGGGGATAITTVPAVTTTKTKATTTIKTSGTSKDTTSIVWKLQAPAFFIAGSSTLFDAHLSADPRGGELSFLWDFGDDSTPGTTNIVTHIYDLPGIYNASVRATSTEGTVGIKNFLVKVVSDQPVPEGIFVSGLSPRPEAEDEEWISLSSHSTSTTDISLWKFGTGDDKWYTIPPNTLLKPSSTLRFSRSVTHLILNNEGGAIYLVNQIGKTVDLLTFGKGSPGQAYLLTDGGWDWLPKTTTTGKVLGVKISATKSKTSPQTTYHTLTIADARSASPGTAVWVKGTVESLPNAPGSNYFYIKDDTGGIQIYSYKKSFPHLALNENVRVYGELGTIQGLPRVKTKTALAITAVSGTSTLPQNIKSIAEVDENDYGTLLTLEGEITKNQSTYFYLDDGSAESTVSLLKGANIDKKDLKTGTRIRVSGIVEQNATGWRLIPRSPADLLILKPETTSTLAISSTNSPPTSTSTKIIFGAGGLMLVALAFVAKKFLMK